jgi:transposase-like protein
MSTMRKYTREFRESAVRLVPSGEVTLRKAAEDLGMPYCPLHGWVRAAQRAGRKATPKEPPRTGSDAEARVRALDAGVSKPTLEKDILEGAAAYFAREQP